MPSLTIAAGYVPSPDGPDQLESLASGIGPGPVLVACSTTPQDAFQTLPSTYNYLQADLGTSEGVARLVEATKTDFLLLVLPGETVTPCSYGPAGTVERMIRVAEDSAAGLVYSDFREKAGEGTTERPLIDYQQGSVRDTFDFGGLVVLSRQAI